jgi:PAS domain S-box-containing protein
VSPRVRWEFLSNRGLIIVGNTMFSSVAGRFTRSAVAIGLVAAVFIVTPLTPLDGPIGGVIALGTVIVCSWYSGPVTAALLPVVVLFSSRLIAAEAKTLIPTPRELMTFGILTLLTTALGLAGQYRRRLQRLLLRARFRSREHARVLGAARMLSCDFTGRITTWSAGVQELYGWTADEASGESIQTLLNMEFPQPFETIRQTLSTVGQWSGEIRLQDRTGRPLIVMTHWIATNDEDGEPSGIVQLHSDVTALRAAEAAAREADHRKDLFLATLAHELRNPLAPLRSGLDLLTMTSGAQPEDREILNIMQRQLGQLVRLIDDLLDLSRINSGKIRLRRERVAVADIIRDAIEAARPVIDAEQHTLDVHVPNEPLVLDVDRTRLAQILINLLNNAAKFTPANGHLELIVAVENDHVRLRVRDNGIGIRPEVLPHVFDLFNQDENLQRRERGGLGIGLCIVKSLVEMHGGTVSAESGGSGLGSEFAVQLPLATAVSTNDAPSKLSATIPAPTGSRVLVVDDNQDAANTLARLLRAEGCDVRTAYSGETALAAAEAFQPQTFVLDLGMPGMSGLDLARLLRARPVFARATLIAVTGWGKDDDRRQSREAGFNHHLVKPIDFAELRKLIVAPEPRPARISPQRSILLRSC